MKKLSALLCMMCASILLAGCSYFDTGEVVEVEDAPPAKIDLTNRAASRNLDTNINEITRYSSHGRVEVFDLDGNAGDVRYYDPASSSGSSGRVNSLNPSVQVFPLDGEMRAVTPEQNMPWQDSGLSPSLAPTPVVSAPLSSNGGVIYFDHGETSLDQSDMEVVNQVTQSFNQRSNALLSVEGYASSQAKITDPIKRKIVNLKTSMNRALSVSRSLIQKGVPAESIRTVAWGETQPAGDEAASRRVEIIGQ